MFRRLRRTNGEIVGFALSGGGSRGASQVGALKALGEAGIWPDVVTGTSAGAVNAAWLAVHPRRLDHLEAIWLSLRTRDVFPGTAFHMFANMTRYGYIHASERWEAFLRSHVGTARFEDAAIPCGVVAVRLADGERVIFDSGEIVPAIMASTAIPGVFPPYRVGDELYVDGGVLEPLPVPALLEHKVTTIYALDCSGFSSQFNGGSVPDRTGRIAAAAAARHVTSLPSVRGRTVHLLRPELPDLEDARDFRRTTELIEAGYEHTRGYLADRIAPRPTG